MIVLTEPVAVSLAGALDDYLWNNLQEEPFDPPITGTPDTLDGADSNTLPGDRHGWNFGAESANFTPDTTIEAHGTAVTTYVLEVLANAPDGLGENVKIMYVIPDGDKLNGGSDALDCILAHKNAGINIVAVGAPTSGADRAGAEALAEKGIMLIGGLDNSNISYDAKAGDETDWAFYNATRRFGVQYEPLDNVFPVTTDPRGEATAYGINSFYAGVARYDGDTGINKQSFAGPQAAAMAALAARAYQLDNSGVNPSVQQIKRALMSGVSYFDGLDNRSITHDYGLSGRDKGGVLILDDVLEAINEPDSLGVSMEGEGGGDRLAGNHVEF